MRDDKEAILHAVAIFAFNDNSLADDLPHFSFAFNFNFRFISGKLQTEPILCYCW